MHPIITLDKAWRPLDRTGWAFLGKKLVKMVAISLGTFHGHPGLLLSLLKDGKSLFHPQKNLIMVAVLRIPGLRRGHHSMGTPGEGTWWRGGWHKQRGDPNPFLCREFP